MTSAHYQQWTPSKFVMKENFMCYRTSMILVCFPDLFCCLNFQHRVLNALVSSYPYRNNCCFTSQCCEFKWAVNEVLSSFVRLFHPVHNEQCHFYMVDCNAGGPGEKQWQSSGFSASSVLSRNAWGLCAQQVVPLTWTSADPSKEHAEFLLRPYYLHAVHCSTLCLSVVRCLLLKCWKWRVMILLFEKS